MSQDFCSAAALFTNVFPLTSNGLVESPLSCTAGAARPPSAALLVTDVEVATDAAVTTGVEVAIAVLLENGAEVLIASPAVAVADGKST